MEASSTEGKDENVASSQETFHDAVMTQEGCGGPAVSSSASHLSKVQLEKVDAAFESLFGYPWGTHFALPKELSPRDGLLVQMLGGKSAALILRANPSTTRRRAAPSSSKPVVHRKTQQYKWTSSSSKSEMEIENDSRRTATAVAASTPTTASAAAATAGKQAGGGGGGGGVGQLLKDLAAPEKLSTVAKTSKDWDRFKDDTGLGDKLEEHADSKNAYLKRQDFLNRVDHRRFELEKKERDVTRAKRGS